MMFSPETSLSSIHFVRGLLSLFLLCFSIYSLISEASSPSLKFLTHLHLHLRNFSPDSPSPISIAEASPSPIHRFTLTNSPHLTHSPIHRFTLTHSPSPSPSPSPISTDSPSPILKGFWVWVQILQKRSSVGVGGFSSIGVGADCKSFFC